MSDLCFIWYEILSVIKCTREIISCWHTSRVEPTQELPQVSKVRTRTLLALITFKGGASSEVSLMIPCLMCECEMSDVIVIHPCLDLFYDFFTTDIFLIIKYLLYSCRKHRFIVSVVRLLNSNISIREATKSYASSGFWF